MRLRFDAQLSPTLVGQLADVFPDSRHVHDLGLATSSDRAIWDHARLHDLDIVTKDADFTDLAIALGAPPRVIWLRIGNCTTEAIAALLREQRDLILEFGQDQQARVLALNVRGTAQSG